MCPWNMLVRACVRVCVCVCVAGLGWVGVGERRAYLPLCVCVCVCVCATDVTRGCRETWERRTEPSRCLSRWRVTARESSMWLHPWKDAKQCGRYCTDCLQDFSSSSSSSSSSSLCFLFVCFCFGNLPHISLIDELTHPFSRCYFQVFLISFLCLLFLLFCCSRCLFVYIYICVCVGVNNKL